MQDNKKYTVITSINSPTKAVQLFRDISCKNTVIVVGDKKTPQNWQCEGVDFIDTGEQAKMFPELSENIPWNHYARKMLGYAYAIQKGAHEIVDTDDDNFPKANYCFPSNKGTYGVILGDERWVNIYSYYFSDWKIWPRGFPLDKIIDTDSLINVKNQSNKMPVGIWQGLADIDPDVDAIYRLIDARDIVFSENPPVILGQNIWSPFNSQNTQFSKKFFHLLYLPTTVTFRFTDILRSYVAQPILWANGHFLGFSSATVVQERNYHNNLEDFRQEVPFYSSATDICKLIKESILPEQTIADQMRAVYKKLLKHNIVDERELISLEAWLEVVE